MAPLEHTEQMDERVVAARIALYQSSTLRSKGEGARDARGHSPAVEDTGTLSPASGAVPAIDCFSDSRPKAMP